MGSNPTPSAAAPSSVACICSVCRPRPLPPFKPAPTWELDNDGWSGWSKKNLKRLATEMSDEIGSLKRRLNREESVNDKLLHLVCTLRHDEYCPVAELKLSWPDGANEHEHGATAAELCDCPTGDLLRGIEITERPA